MSHEISDARFVNFVSERQSPPKQARELRFEPAQFRRDSLLRSTESACVRRVAGSVQFCTHDEYKGELLKNRQLALGGLRFFSTSTSVIIIIIGATGHSWNPARP